MFTLVVVLAFPLLLSIGYGALFLLSGRNERVLAGPLGFLWYLLLLSVPTGVVLATYSDRVLAALAIRPTTLWWLLPAVLLGAALWGVQQWGLPGQTPDASKWLWCGSPGKLGFVLLMAPVAYGVVAEEIVWRAYLIPELGLLLAAVAFALHHFHFGFRHMAFSLIAGLAWGGVFVLLDDLWPPAASHLTYNALAWRSLRSRAAALQHVGTPT